MNWLALAVEILLAVLTAAGILYSMLALVAARSFERQMRRAETERIAPGVSVLKPLKGDEPRMYAGFCESLRAGVRR